MTGGPETVICRYRVKPGKTAEMEALLARHWPALHAVGLVTDDPPQRFRGLSDDAGENPETTTYIEIFTWKSADGARVAHETPAIAAIWEPMGALCEHMEFPHFEPISLG